ncbi:hypothetical protein EWM64_g9122 [Hericium alpestre]|uniref:HNH nuclease domain-containing protein n=1 Tax=Hericium alpestre TaxID=135208 RepID=A0A4Y9ZN90_9AGAM|nr:hypothetical protein EWM64_g9122 [Hericium alpestre]
MLGFPLPAETTVWANRPRSEDLRSTYGFVLEAEQAALSRFERRSVTERTALHALNVVCARLVGYLILEPLNDVAQSYVLNEVKCRQQCHGTSEGALNTAIYELGLFYVNHYVRPFKKYQRCTPPRSGRDMPRLSFDKKQEYAKEFLKSTPTSLAEAKCTALIRDNHRCMVSGKYDINSVRFIQELKLEAIAANAGACCTQCCHIISDSANVDPSSAKERPSTASVWTVLTNFGETDLRDEFSGVNAHRLDNVLTLDAAVHTAFDNLDIWFDKAEPSDPSDHHYYLRTSYDADVFAITRFPTDVRFVNHAPDPDQVPLPNPRYLRIHAACARVAHMSGASDPQVFWSTFVRLRLVLTEGISPRDKTGAVAHARQTLNNELSALHLAMCSLRSRYNALSPISVLPPEVLVRIFQFHATMCPPSLRCLGWIKVTHICRLWRDTALQFPSLWSNICYTMGLRWAELMLARAKAAPISVRRDVTGASKLSLQHISEHLSHTRELGLIGHPVLLKPIIDTLPSLPGTLETLELGPAYLNVLDLEKFELPGAIAGCRLPALRRLALRGLWVSWSAPILCGLTHLEMQLHKTAANSYPSLSQETLFCTLKAMPALESLILKDCFPSGPWKDGNKVLQLSRLHILRLHGPSTACFAIGKRLQIPASCQVDLRCEDDTDIADILPFLMAHIYNGKDLPPWYTLSLYANENNYLNLEMWRLSEMLEGEEDRNNPQMDADLTITFRSPERSLDPLKAVCQVMPLHSIRAVRAFITVNIAAKDWIGLLGQCTGAEVAWVGGTLCTSFCDALAMTTDCKYVAESENCAQEVLFLGKLEDLHLSEADFRDRRVEGRDPSEYLLTGWLTDRQQVKAAPKLKIDLQDCSIKEEWVERLTMKAATVHWDDNEGKCGDESDSDEDG